MSRKGTKAKEKDLKKRKDAAMKDLDIAISKIVRKHDIRVIPVAVDETMSHGPIVRAGTFYLKEATDEDKSYAESLLVADTILSTED